MMSFRLFLNLVHLQNKRYLWSCISNFMIKGVITGEAKCLNALNDCLHE